MTRHSKVAASAGAMAVALALTATACTSSTDPGGSEPIEFDLPTWQAQEPGTGDWWEALAAEFESLHEGVTVTISGTTPSSAHADEMAIRMAAGDPPSILHLPASRVHEFNGQGWIEPITELLESEGILDRWTPLQTALEDDGEALGLLLLGYTQQMYYNEKLLDEAGVPVPTDAEEFLAAVTSTTVDTDGDGAVDQFGFTMPTAEASALYQAATIWTIGAGGQWARDGVVTADDPATIEGIGWLLDAFADGSIPQGLNIAQANQLFYEGKAAFTFDGPWIYAGFNESARPEVAEHLRVAPLPFAHYAGGASNSLQIPTGLSERERQLAEEFITLAASDEWQLKYAELATLPPPSSTALDEAFLAEHPIVASFVTGVSEAVNQAPGGFEDQYSEFSRIVTDGLVQAIVEGDTAEVAAARIAEQLDAAMG